MIVEFLAIYLIGVAFFAYILGFLDSLFCLPFYDFSQHAVCAALWPLTLLIVLGLYTIYGSLKLLEWLVEKGAEQGDKLK